ncbi:MAG: MerC domain-containing protein [Candidatus Caenarcaniphilales bacterium]|nr:MerC domain-containing protein [Candidatus Caenarcaniphilales bacterium]
MRTAPQTIKSFFQPSSCGKSCGHTKKDSIKDSAMDKLGLWSSLICSIHCLATPIVLGIFFSLKVSTSMIEGWESIDLICLFLAPIFAWFSLKHGLNQHGSAWPSGIFSFGFVFLLLGVYSFSGDHHLVHTEGAGEHMTHSYLMIIGGILVAVSHTLNLYLSRSSAPKKVLSP